MAYPANFRYTKQHEWTDVKGDVVFSNISVAFGPPGDMHFGMNALHGVIRSVDPE